LVVAGTLCAAALPVINPTLGVVFPGDKARELTKQCSRNGPAHVTGTWTPDVKQIAELEKDLVAALSKADSPEVFKARDFSHLARQYGGIADSVHKLIYVNAFTTRDNNGDWRKRAVMVCDGGPAFFGVEYDPSAKTFSHFEFNGAP
jgi:hypothetical protein